MESGLGQPDADSPTLGLAEIFRTIETRTSRTSRLVSLASASPQPCSFRKHKPSLSCAAAASSRSLLP